MYIKGYFANGDSIFLLASVNLRFFSCINNRRSFWVIFLFILKNTEQNNIRLETSVFSKILTQHCHEIINFETSINQSNIRILNFELYNFKNLHTIYEKLQACRNFICSSLSAESEFQNHRSQFTRMLALRNYSGSFQNCQNHTPRLQLQSSVFLSICCSVLYDS